MHLKAKVRRPQYAGGVILKMKIHVRCMWINFSQKTGGLKMPVNP